MRAVPRSFEARRQTPSQMLLTSAEEATIHEAQKSLRNQLRKNPHPPERRPAKSYARMGDRTSGFFCGRLKRLALSSGRAVHRGVLGRRSRQPATRMDTAEHTHITGEQRALSNPDPSTRDRGATSAGSTRGSVEEERPRTYPGGVAYRGRKHRNTQQRRSIGRTTTSNISYNLSSPSYYCYHTDDTDTHTPRACATNLVAPRVAVEDRGGAA